jgi:hypothetical protein
MQTIVKEPTPITTRVVPTIPPIVEQTFIRPDTTLTQITQAQF